VRFQKYNFQLSRQVLETPDQDLLLPDVGSKISLPSLYQDSRGRGSAGERAALGWSFRRDIIRMNLMSHFAVVLMSDLDVQQTHR
jgi:hypothetical protein